MSESLRLDCDPIDQPAALDPIERSSWSALQIRVGHRTVSRVWDGGLGCERSTLYLPAFSLVRWFVDNWWCVLHERCPFDVVPRTVNRTNQSWIRRHNLRSAASDLQLPALFLFHDGEELRAEWQADPVDPGSSQAVEFVGAGKASLDSVTSQEALGTFIQEVFSRLDAIGDDDVRATHETWRAIQAAGSEEQDFCRLAGRMGLNPYDPGEVSDELAQFLETAFPDVDAPLVRDLTEVAQPEFVAAQWSWTKEVSSQFSLEGNPRSPRLNVEPRGQSPPLFGYRLAQEVRQAISLPPDVPMISVEDAATEVLESTFRIYDQNHIPGKAIQSLVGRSRREVVAVGPQPAHPHMRRFLAGRSLYHALATIGTSHRLVTKAYSWHQKASRAFSAELLAPRVGLVTNLSGSEYDQARLNELSSFFQVSSKVIERQLENAGLATGVD